MWANIEKYIILNKLPSNAALTDVGKTITPDMIGDGAPIYITPIVSRVNPDYVGLLTRPWSGMGALSQNVSTVIPYYGGRPTPPWWKRTRGGN